MDGLNTHTDRFAVFLVDSRRFVVFNLDHRRRLLTVSTTDQLRMLESKLLEAFFRIPNPNGLASEEEIDLDGIVNRILRHLREEYYGRTYLFQSTTAGLRIYAVDDHNCQKVKDRVDVECLWTEAAKHFGCRQGHGSTAKTPTYREEQGHEYLVSAMYIAVEATYQRCQKRCPSLESLAGKFRRDLVQNQPLGNGCKAQILDC